LINKLNKKIKKMDFWDISFTKIAVMFFVMFLFSILPSFRNFIQSINPLILFFIWVIFALRPLKRFFSKSN